MALDSNTNEYIFAIRIVLDQDIAEDTEIGLYNTGGNSEFRWIVSEIAGTTIAWAHGIININGIRSFGSEADLRWGGDVEYITPSGVSVDNTGDYPTGSGDPLSQRLTDAEISIQGKVVDVYRFDAVTAAGDGTVVHRAKVGQYSSGETKLTIPFENNQLRRNAALGTKVNLTTFPDASSGLIGLTVPPTFGTFDFAKFIRVEDSEKIYQNASGFIFDDSPLVTTSWRNGADALFATAFPVVGSLGSPPLRYNIKISRLVSDFYWKVNGSVITSGAVDLSNLIGNFMRVTEGTGSGKYRRISFAEVDLDEDPTIIKLTIDSYFEETLVGNATATAGGQSWVKIVDIARTYQADIWKAKAYVLATGELVSTSPDLYSFTDEKKALVTTANTNAIVSEKPFQFLLLPNYAYQDSQDGNINSLNIDLMLFTSSPDQMDSFIIRPVVGLDKIKTPDLRLWSNLNGVVRANNIKLVDGLYGQKNPATYDPPIILTQTIDTSLATDKDFASLVRYRATFNLDSSTTANHATIGFRFEKAAIPEFFEFDSVFLGLRVLSEDGPGGLGPPAWNFDINYRRFIGTPKTIKRVTFNSGDIVNWETLPDFYYTANIPNTGNKNFYFEQNSIESPAETINLSGYNLLSIPDASDTEKYNAIAEFAFFVPITNLTFTVVTVNVHELAIIFKKSLSIKEALYSGYQGRIFDDTWGARKTAVDLMANPIDILEHVCRLQNFGETGEVDTNWGKEYATSALINISSSDEGGFDFPLLDPLKELPIGNQIFSYGDTFTEELKRSLCQEFFLCSYSKHVDTDAGKESVSYIVPKYGDKGIAITETIDLTKVVGNISPVLEPSIEDIFVEPLIQYAYNYGSEKFDGLLQITNVAQSSYDPSYVFGDLDGVTAELAWTMCHKLYLYYGQIEPLPKQVSESPWIRDIATAKNKLFDLLKIMGAVDVDGTPANVVIEPRKRLMFRVPYEVAKDYHLCKHANLSFPHQTASQTVEAFIEAYMHNPQTMTTALRFILMGTTGAIEYFIKDTYGTGVSPDWKDTWQEFVIHGEGADVIDSY